MDSFTVSDELPALPSLGRRCLEAREPSERHCEPPAIGENNAQLGLRYLDLAAQWGCVNDRRSHAKLRGRILAVDDLERHSPGPVITRPQTIRRRLLGDQVLLILLLSGTLLATTFLGARRAVEGLSGEIIERATDQAEAELRRFFDPVASALLALRSWSESGLAGDGDPEAFRQLILPVVERLPQVSGVIRADESGHEYFLVPIDGAWRLRVTLKPAYKQTAEVPGIQPIQQALDCT